VEEKDWIESECISIGLKKEEEFLPDDEFGWLANNTLHYDGSLIDKTYYKITNCGIFIKFIKKQEEGKDIETYRIHFVPHSNITLFEAFELLEKNKNEEVEVNGKL